MDERPCIFAQTDSQPYTFLMKRLYSLAVAMGTAVLASAQLTGLSVDVVMEHDGTVDPSLDGFTTYRVYADLTNDLDFVSAVYGDATYPLSLGCDGTIFQSSGVNYNYANQVNALFFEAFPTTEYDSWLTIGAEDSDGGVNIQSTDDTMTPALNLFNAGEGFIIADPIGASWFNVYPCSGWAADTLADCADGNPAFGGADNRVLLAQITANGDIYGMFNLQVFPNGSQAGAQSAIGQTFSSDATDVFGCTNMAATNYDPSANIDDLSCVLPCTVELSLDNVTTPSCNGENDALIQVSATGVQGADYYYIGDTSGVAQNFGNFGNLVAGMYDIYVIDAAGCLDQIEVEVPVTGEVEVNAVLTSPVSCNGADDAVLTVESTEGGSGVFEYYISTNPTVLTTQTEWTNLEGGYTYIIWAVDENGCSGSSTPVQVQQPTPINVSLAPAGTVDASCDGTPGEIYVVGLGGNAPATIEFSVDGTNYGPSPILVPGGTYTVTAQDVYGCIGTLETEIVIGPDPIIVNAMSMPEACFGDNTGEVSWAPVGGQGVYTYEFDGMATSETMAGDLAPGDYDVTVTDQDGCSETVTITVYAAVEIAVSAEVIDASCFGENDGEVTLTATGGTGSFQYSENGNNYSQNNNFDGLLAGSATFFVQDENGCVQTTTATVGEPEAIVVTAIVSEGSVTGEGTIDVTVTGGSLPYTYEWIGPGVSGTDTQDLNNISSGAYTVEVTDANGCSTTETFNITTSIVELEGGVEASVFPNPSSGLFQLNVNGWTSGELNYTIVDAQGRVIRRGQWFASNAMFQTTIDLGQEEAGVYRLLLENEGRPTAIPLMKTN